MSVNLNNIDLRISAGFERQFPTDRMPQIVFSGRSNVGKSSLINCLLGRKSLARVSATPGKTITVNFYDIDKKLFFVDLPGYGFAARDPENREAWSKLTDGYFTRNKNADLIKAVIQLIDSKAGVTDDDRLMLRWMNASGFPYVVVITKTDKLNKTERQARIDSVTADRDIPDGTPIVPFSTLGKGEGKQELWSKISLFSGIKL